jgi:hypothetical protein
MGEYEQRIPHGGGANGHIRHDTADDGPEELMMSPPHHITHIIKNLI